MGPPPPAGAAERPGPATIASKATAARARRRDLEARSTGKGALEAARPRGEHRLIPERHLDHHRTASPALIGSRLLLWVRYPTWPPRPGFGEPAAEAIIPFPHLAWPGEARRRSPSPHPGAPPASPGTPSARGGEAPARRATPARPGPDRRAPLKEAGPRARAGHPAVGTETRRSLAVARSGSPPRGPRGGGGDRAARGSRAWSGRPAPSGARDAPRPTGARSPGSGSPGPGTAALAAAPGESSGSGLRLPGGAP